MTAALDEQRTLHWFEATPNDKNQEKGGEVLRRLSKTPPDPKTGRGEKPKKEVDDEASKTLGLRHRPRTPGSN